MPLMPGTFHLILLILSGAKTCFASVRLDGLMDRSFSKVIGEHSHQLNPSAKVFLMLEVHHFVNITRYWFVPRKTV